MGFAAPSRRGCARCLWRGSSQVASWQPPRTVAQTPLPVGAGLEHSGLPEQQVLVSEVHSPLRPVQVVSTLHSCSKEAAGI